MFQKIPRLKLKVTRISRDLKKDPSLNFETNKEQLEAAIVAMTESVQWMQSPLDSREYRFRDALALRFSLIQHKRMAKQFTSQLSKLSASDPADF